jgi:hypothetical protein
MVVQVAADVFQLIREWGSMLATIGLVIATVGLVWATLKLRDETRRLAKYSIMPKLTYSSYWEPNQNKIRVYIKNIGIGLAFIEEVLVTHRGESLKPKIEKPEVVPGDQAWVDIPDPKEGEKIDVEVKYRDIDNNFYPKYKFTVTVESAQF